MRPKQYHSECSHGLVYGGRCHFSRGKEKKKKGEILSYHVGCGLSHISLGLSISIPDAGHRQGESERWLFLLLCPLSSRYLSRWQGLKKKSSGIKGTNYILPQTFGLMSKQGSVVISALSPQPPCFSLSRATCSKAGD